MNFPFFPRQASTTAVKTDEIYFFLLGFSVLMLAMIFLPMIYCLFKYRRGHKANREPLQINTNKVEITWTILPTIVAMGMFVWGTEVYFYEEVPPKDPLQINVIGKQWMWKIQHQEGNREINALHVPVNRAVELTMGSEDVIHSLSIPAFRTKQDVVPGRFTTEWFRATRVGAYDFYCTEYCGAGHADMRGKVYVLSPAGYERWLAATAPKDTLAQDGGILFHELGCSGCHENSQTVHAPPLEGLYGRTVPLADGTFASVDDQYIHDHIFFPTREVPAGYQAVMPSFQGRVSEAQVFELVAYIKSLANQQPPQNRAGDEPPPKK
jgi:cytochrome c oxidase subunit II